MRSLLAAVLWLSLAACSKDAPSAAPVVAAKDAGAVPTQSVHLVITGHETGLLPAAAPRLLAQWKAQEHWPDTLLLSTGDLFSGQALSSHFDGLPTAEVMKLLTYRAAALGNHDLELGLDTLSRFRAAAGLHLLAANLAQPTSAQPAVEVEPFVVLEAHGVKVGVVGLTSEKTIKTTAWGRAAGLSLRPLEPTLTAAVEGARKAGALALVVVVDDCFAAVQPAFLAHPEWKVDVVVGSRCEGAQEATAVGTRFLSIGDDLSVYVSATVQVTAAGLTSVTASRVAVAPNGPEDEDLKAIHARWQARLDADLGQKLGFARKGYAEDAPELRWLVATALQVQTKADAALINQKGIRAALPKGELTRATVHSLLPFENAVVLVKVPGEVLLKLKADRAAYVLLPAKVDPAATYTLVTTEYLYFGGDGLGLELVDPSPQPNGQMWQTPVMEWLAAQKTDERHPLERVLQRR